MIRDGTGTREVPRRGRGSRGRGGRRGAPLIALLWVLLCPPPAAAVSPEEEVPAPASALRVAPETVRGERERAAAAPAEPLPDREGLVPGRAYRLSELIDLAERNNPRTRIAWEEAREAAAAVGMAQSLYYPMLSLAAVGIYERIPLPFPKLLSFGKGYLDVDTGILRAEAVLEWLVLDCGRRSLTVEAARRNRVAAGHAFNAEHQQLALEVAARYYALSALNAQAAASRAALEDADSVAESAQALRERGLATVPQELLARQARVQAAFDLEKVLADEANARVALAQSVGAPPPADDLAIADLGAEPLPGPLAESPEQAVARALARRQDLKALTARLRAAEAGVRVARAAYWPRVLLRGNAGPAYNNFRVDDFSWASTFMPQYGGALLLDWAVFQGFENRHQVSLAESQQARIRSELALARDAVQAEVWQAYRDAETSRRRLDVADSLLETSQAAYDAALASYQEGLATFPEVSTARAALAQARAAVSETRAEVFLSWAVLSFLTGDLRPPGEGERP